MNKQKKPNGYWTKERCLEEALKYETIGDFYKKGKGAYSRASKNGFLDEICVHMTRLQKPNGYWTKERCHEEALKYTTKKEFRKKSKVAYTVAVKDGFFNEICRHIISNPCKPNGYWTKERCLEEALKYETRIEFEKCGKGAYNRARKDGFLDEICSHMTTVYTKNSKKRYVYMYEFEDKSVYVGLTCNINRRKTEHLKSERSSVYRHIKNNPNIKYNFNVVGCFDTQEAVEKERFYVDDYKSKKWNVLNVAKTGSIGIGIIKWAKEKCQEEALKYKTKSEFAKKCSGAYNKARKDGFLDEICSHMINGNVKWTKEKCHEEAKKYKTRNSFGKGCSNAYERARKQGFLNEICQHMNKKQKA